MARRRGPSQGRSAAVPCGGPTWFAADRPWRTATVPRRRGNRWISAWSAPDREPVAGVDAARVALDAEAEEERPRPRPAVAQRDPLRAVAPAPRGRDRVPADRPGAGGEADEDGVAERGPRDRRDARAAGDPDAVDVGRVLERVD